MGNHTAGYDLLSSRSGRLRRHAFQVKLNRFLLNKIAFRGFNDALKESINTILGILGRKNVIKDGLKVLSLSASMWFSLTVELLPKGTSYTRHEDVSKTESWQKYVINLCLLWITDPSLHLYLL